MRRDEFPIVEVYVDDKIREELKSIISAAEEHIRDVKSDDPKHQEFYEMGERHILEIVKLHLKVREEKK